MPCRQLGAPAAGVSGLFVIPLMSCFLRLCWLDWVGRAGGWTVGARRQTCEASKRQRWLLGVAMLGFTGSSVLAASPEAVPQPISVPPIAGQRLSEWLLSHAGVAVDTTALHWTVRAQRVAQVPLQQAAQDAVRALPQPPNWHTWFEALPVTGRLPVAHPAPRSLQVLPREDPVLRADDGVTLFPRPQWVGVLGTRGSACLFEHRPEAQLRDLLRACWGAAALRDIDWVWWVSPSGESARVGVADWNRQPWPVLAPGSWLWAPSRQSGLMPEASDNIAKFLATQPPLEFMAQQPPNVQRVRQQGVVTSAPRAASALAVTSNDWGETGLLQTPSARMMPEGSARFHISRLQPYTRGNVFVQPFDWLETGFRYTDVANRRYGPESFSGTQSYKDKSIDVRLRLREEDAAWPAVVAGVRDIGGTGLFSSEYVVASKRWGDWDASLGLGWGYLGSQADVKNPLSGLLGRSASRVGDRGEFGGTTNTGAWFTGPTALFGGVQVQASPNWVLKAEWDGNDYQHEPQNNPQVASSRVNVGALYRQNPYVDWTVSWERGQRLGVGVTVHSGPETLSGLTAPKVLDAPLPPWGEAGSRSELDLAQAIQRATGWRLVQQQSLGTETVLVVEVDNSPYLRDRVNSLLRLAHLQLPPEQLRVVVQLQRRGLGVQRWVVDRAEWVAQQTQATVPALRLPALTPMAPQALRAQASDAQAYSGFTGLRWRLGPDYKQVLGGPNGFVLYQLGARAEAEWDVTEGTWLAGRVDLRALDNYSVFKADAPDTGAPKVRSELRRYLTTSRVTLPLWQATRVDDWHNGWFSSVYGGYLEPMFGGVGTEWLYQAWGAPWALGLDLNHVRQRAFDQGLAFRTYTVNTGHLSAYWDLGGRGVQAKVSMGRYLAGDWGATLDLSRRFGNGVAMGFWATKTNMPVAQFGEGSFDKGFYVNIPFDALLPNSTPGTARVVWNPLTRDGGARLNRRYALHDLLQGRASHDWAIRTAQPSTRHSADDLTAVTAPGSPSLWGQARQGLKGVVSDASALPMSTWAWALGTVALSARLDERAQRWASTHQGGLWQGTRDLGKALPYAMIAGASLLAMGDPADASSRTARTALVAGASSYVLNQGLRFVVGRARPNEGLGASAFDGGRGRAFQSGFASNHTALAFALATPYAQNFDAPWAYGAAALTGLSRVQSGDHWFSDVVAGGLLGYGVASLINSRENAADRGWHWRLGWNQVGATYRYQ